MTKKWLVICLFVGALLTLACNAPLFTPRPTPTPTFTPTPTATPTPSVPPTPTPLPEDTGWQTVQPGIEIRSLNVAVGTNVERVTIARLDPAAVMIRVLYAPGAPALVSAWAQQTGAVLVINAGYFTEEKIVTGLIISNRERFGTPYGDFAGMLAVTDTGEVSVRWLRAWPYDPAEPLREAVQCFPVLVKPGGVMGFPADADDGRPARRTVVAQDQDGRILMLVAPRGFFSLHTLAAWLADADLGVDIALNLDGGTSSGLWIPNVAMIDSLVAVPAVIAVMPR
ncbi:MAG TPA: phosphodiester glycosidase family protein [Anaerolineae bacterium]|nr:phosphodiester glycosidase family protein [Anaerolineae bacterium]HQI86544.1 phosphodiester glycosidase family protein [Anaerolineae bacterium]